MSWFGWVGIVCSVLLLCCVLSVLLLLWVKLCRNVWVVCCDIFCLSMCCNCRVCLIVLLFCLVVIWVVLLRCFRLSVVVMMLFVGCLF